MRKITLPLGLVALLLISGELLVSWSFAVPIFEGPDEPAHWQYALYIHQNGALPVYGTTYAEANQPPLYYLLIAPFTAPIEYPRFLKSENAQPTGFNLYEHSSLDLKYGSVRMVRLITIVFSLLTVLFCYWIGLEASGKPMAGLLTAGVVAFLPQFTFRGMNVSNDALLTLLCAIATFWIVRLMKRGFIWQDSLVAGVAMGLAFLSRINAMIMPLPFGLALVSQEGPWRNRLRGLAGLAITLIVVAPWLISNQIQYGDPFAFRVLTTEVAFPYVRSKPITSPYFITEFPVVLFQSFIGRFGWAMNVILPDWIYLAFGLFILVSMLGLIWRTIHHRRDRRLILILLVIPLLSLATIVYLNLTFSIPFGRYLLPALPAIATLIVLGLEGLPGWSDDIALGILAELALLNVFILQTIVIPAHGFGTE